MQSSQVYKQIKKELKDIPLLESLKRYSEREVACFDVPGHVKDGGNQILNSYLGKDAVKMDINSSPRMDNVSNPQGIIKNAQDLLAKSYEADHAFFITNGTTQAIHAMILSTINPGDKVLLPRNIHKSVINALILVGGEPIFIEPEFDKYLGISLNVDENKIINIINSRDDIKAIFLLNPTYYGACTDLSKIINECKEKDIIVLIDEAHGAHFPYNEELPTSSIKLNADMVAVSLHKTGGALTQASALFVNEGKVNLVKVRQSINMLQSTSASYLLMASIDAARYNLEENGRELLDKALNLSRYAKLKINQIPGIQVVSTEQLGKKGVHFFDETKLCINVSDLNLTGFEVYDLLFEKYDVQMELGDLYNVLALVSIGTSKKDIDKLIKALKDISKLNRTKEQIQKIEINPISPIMKITPRNAFYSDSESIEIDKAINRVSSEYIMAYPPGIPIVIPGELITEEIIDYIKILKNTKAHLTDMKDKDLKTILVIKN